VRPCVFERSRQLNFHLSGLNPIPRTHPPWWLKLLAIPSLPSFRKETFVAILIHSQFCFVTARHEEKKMIIEKTKTLVSQLFCNKCAKRRLEKIIIIYQNRNIRNILFSVEHDSDKNDPAHQVEDYRAAITAQGTSRIQYNSHIHKSVLWCRWPASIILYTTTYYQM